MHASGYQLANLSPVPRQLDLLGRYELIEPELPFSHAFPDGGIVSVHRDVEKTVVVGTPTGATGVRLTTGEEIRAERVVVSNVDPTHLVRDLQGPSMVGQGIVDRTERYELGDSVLVMFVALDRPVNYKAGPEARQSAHVHLSEPSLDYPHHGRRNRSRCRANMGRGA
ncbi:MAG TPA: hypothetical protein VIP11_25855 [Gemmatimonadaceae bacterium]